MQAGQTATLKLGPHEYNTEFPQALIVVLPPKDVTIDLVDAVRRRQRLVVGIR